MDTNAITKADVLEFEKMMGSDVNQMLKMMDVTKGYVCIHVCMYVCTHVSCMYVHMYVCIHECMYI